MLLSVPSLCIKLVLPNRIIKLKIGFRLLPAALTGLASITHLINMDTVQDLLTLLRNLLEDKAPAAPPLVQLYCVNCALRTLSGPGEELNLDNEVFIIGLQKLIFTFFSEGGGGGASESSPAFQLPGDVVLTGTPAGVGPLVAGNTVAVSIEGVGTLTNPVVSR